MTLLILDKHGSRIGRDLGGAPTVQDDPREGLDQEAAIVTTQECPGDQSPVDPCGTPIQLFSECTPASFARPVQLVERLVCLEGGGEFVSEPFDELKVERGVEFVIYTHGGYKIVEYHPRCT